MKIGEKVRALRVRAGITQAALAGDRITRNMLCQIERGTAQPSLPTLLYLAEQLHVSAAYFLSESDDYFPFRKAEVLPEMKQLARDGDYAAALARWNEADGMDDEVAFFLACCAQKQGEKHFTNGSMDSAQRCFEQSARFCTMTRYPTAFLRARGVLYSAIAKNVASPMLVFSEKEYAALSEEAMHEDLYHYFREDYHHNYSNPLYQTHLSAKAQMREGMYAKALPLLQQLETERDTAQMNAFLLFRIYADMETCYRELRDFEGAYRYASKRLNQLSVFKS